MQTTMEESPYISLRSKSQMVFSYETNNNMKVEDKDDLQSKIYYLDKHTQSYRILNYQLFNDSLTLNQPVYDPNIKLHRACILKRLVSKKKKRFQTETFDLDLAYITKRVLAMGYPSSGCETIYRNNIKDVMQFFQLKHHNHVKIYNLCIESDRIYNKDVFQGLPVGLFPSKDHNPCPVKLILEFCVDISIYLIKNPDAVAAIHCKAGKGRTGVMICCYLIFSGLCRNTDEALALYADRRTHNKRGVTIASQVRYIEYFETFLMTNFAPPYIHMIPKMVKYYININTTNMIANYIKDPSYFVTPNSFYLNSIKIGPFSSKKSLTVKVEDFLQSNFKGKLSDTTRIEETEKNNEKLYYFIIEFHHKNPIKSDLKVSVKGFGLKFYFWCNLWYTALDLVKVFIDQVQMECFISREPTQEVHPKLKLTSSMYHKKNKYNMKKEFPEIEMRSKKNLKEGLIEEPEDSNISIQQLRHENSYSEGKKIEGNIFETGLDKVNTQIDRIYEIIDSLNNDTDLNILIDTINTIRLKDNKSTFSKSKLNISFCSDEVDKFSEKKRMHKDFSVELNFQLNEKDKDKKF